MVSFLLRATRWVVSVMIALHVKLLRIQALGADKVVAKAAKNVAIAERGEDHAREALAIAKVNVREFNDKLVDARVRQESIRIACDAECQHYGHSL